MTEPTVHLPAPLRSGDVVVVVGVGASGMAAIRVLERLGMSIAVIEADPEHAALDEVRARGHRVVTEAGLTDTVPPEHPARAESSRRPPAADAIDQLLEELLDTAALVVPSPGVSEHARVLVAALDNAIPVWSEPQLGLRAVPHQTIGVTGTNGKTSTTELITAMLTASGLPALACGNIGRPVADTVLEATADVTLVAELSSFQLRFTERLGLVAGVLLNLAEDHLDWHESMQAYGAAKAQIWHGQGEHDWSIANADDAQTLELQRRYAASQHAQFCSSRAVDLGVGRVEDTSEGDLLAWCDGTTITPLVAVSDLWSSADHHVANVAAAATAAMLVGATRDGVKQAAQAFRPGNHRGIVVAKTAEITWVNDSKATNPHAAAAALTMAPHIVWIAGGVSKGVDFVSLRGRLSNVDHAVVIGEAAAAIASVCRQEGVPVTTATSIEDAVARAEHVATAGATVVLAPACASFDQFANYQERGQRFVQAVDALVGRVAS